MLSFYACNKKNLTNATITDQKLKQPAVSYITKLSNNLQSSYGKHPLTRSPWWEYALVDAAGAVHGAEIGTFLGGPDWGTAGGAVCFGVAASLNHDDVMILPSKGSLINPTIFHNTNNPFEYLGSLHNSILTTGFGQYVSSGVINENNLATFSINAVSSGISEYPTSDISQNVVTYLDNEVAFTTQISNDLASSTIDNNVYTILNDFATILPSFSNTTDLGNYCDNVINAVVNSSDLSSSYQTMLLEILSIGKHSAILHYVNQ